MDDLRQRLANLDDAQRARLADCLREHAAPVRLRAFATLRNGANSTTEELRQFIAERLPAHAVPQAVEIVEDLPHLPNGKVDRRALSNLAPVRSQSPAPSKPDSAAEEALLAIWQEVLGTDAISVHDDFFEVGGDSILSIQIISRARTAGLQIAPQDFNAHSTIAKLASLVETEEDPEPKPQSAEEPVEERSFKYLVPIQREGPKLPLFCMHSGGDALLYRGLAKNLGAEFPVYALQPPGLVEDEEPANSIEAIAELYLDEITSVQKEGPYCLLGNCFGAAVGLEIAQQLKARSKEVALLVVVDAAAPVMVSPGRELSIWTAVRERNPGRIWRRFKRNMKAAFTTSAPAAAIRGTYVRTLGSPAQRAQERFRLAHQAYLEAFYRYEPPVFDGNVLFYQGTDSRAWTCDVIEGWREVAPQMKVEDFDCTHRQFLDEPHVGLVAESLSGHLAGLSPGQRYR